MSVSRLAGPALASVRLLLLTACLSFAATCAYAQAQPKSAYEPRVGQEGKDVVWVPTSQALVDKMLDIAKVTPADYVIDLGSGDGRTVITVVKRGARALGIEYNPDMVELAKRNAAAAGVGDRAQFRKADLFETDLSQATVITMFLLPTINMRLRPTLLDLKPGTRIVSNTFTMGDWEPDQKVVLDDCAQWCTALLWIVPARVAGNWRLSDGELTIEQTFQKLSGTLKAFGATRSITDGRVHGDRITFSVGDATYSGVVTGSAISGTVTAGTNRRQWGAVRASQTAARGR